MIIFITSKDHRDMGLSLKGGWGWRDETGNQRPLGQERAGKSQRPELAVS